MTQPQSLSTHALHDLGVHALSQALAARQVSAVDVAQHFLDRANAHSGLGAYVAIQPETTLTQARAADARIANGTAGALEGVPVAHKDIFVTRDFVTTAGSRMLKDYQSPFDATVVSKLAAQGVVTLGKLNCDEFAMGSSNENTAICAVGHTTVEPVRNPWDTTRIPGGWLGGGATAATAGPAPPATPAATRG